MNAIRAIRYRGNRLLPVIGSLVLFGLAACEQQPQPSTAGSYACDEDAYLGTELYGAMRLALDWTPQSLSCEGMPRPDGEGARLHLSGPVSDAPDASTVAFILAMPGLRQGERAKELGTNVTFMEEGSGRFFGTGDTDGCWTDIDYHDAVPGAPGSTYRIGGTVYCVSPLAELNGGSSVSFTELEFAGRLNWDKPE